MSLFIVFSPSRLRKATIALRCSKVCLAHHGVLIAKMMLEAAETRDSVAAEARWMKKVHFWLRAANRYGRIAHSQKPFKS